MSDEIARVRGVYAARTALDDRYSPLRAEQIATAAERSTAWAQGLEDCGHVLGRVLEVGCGSGPLLRWALEAGASSAVGVDILPDRLARATELNPRISYLLADGRSLPFQPRAFDTVICSTMFSSILDGNVAESIAQAVVSVLTERGIVLWFDFFRDNPSNPNVRGIRASEIRALFPGFRFTARRVVLAPPIARRLSRHTGLAAVARTVPFLRTHLAGTLDRAPR